MGIHENQGLFSQLTARRMRVGSTCVPSWGKILALCFVCLLLIMVTVSRNDSSRPSSQQLSRGYRMPWAGIETWMADGRAGGFPYETYETLPNGYPMPWVGLGTWMSEKEIVGQTIEEALKFGYRAVDCAYAYGNQPEIGFAFNKIFNVEKSIKREDVFITSKVWNTFHSYEKAKENIDTILEQLQLDYVDLMLVHWPMGYKEGGDVFPMVNGTMQYSDADYLDTWRAMEEAVEAGKIRSLGLSNFNHNQIQRVMDNSKIKPVLTQIEIHPYFQERELRAWCKLKGISVIAYTPLNNPKHPRRKPGDPNALEEPVIKEIARTHGKTPAQVILRWHVQQGIHVIPKSTNPEHWKANLDIFSFTLSDDEIKRINYLDKNWRILDLFDRDKNHPHYPFLTKDDF